MSWARIDSSLMRSRALETFLRKPSWVWVNEMALARLFEAALVRLICASKRVETARPAASSCGDVILDPELRRARERFSITEESLRFRALT
jgi:hypothetical protein